MIELTEHLDAISLHFDQKKRENFLTWVLKHSPMQNGHHDIKTRDILFWLESRSRIKQYDLTGKCSYKEATLCMDLPTKGKS